MKCASSKCQFSLRFGTRSDFGTRMPRDWLSISLTRRPRWLSTLPTLRVGDGHPVPGLVYWGCVASAPLLSTCLEAHMPGNSSF